MLGFPRVWTAAVALTLLLLSAATSEAADEKKKVAVKPAKPAPRNALVVQEQLKEKTFNKLAEHQRLNRKERKEVAKAELETYKEMRVKGYDEVSNTAEATLMRNYRLRNKKRKGFIRKKDATLAQVLFPGVSPEEYTPNSNIWIYADLVESKKTHVPYEFYDLPGCPQPTESRSVRNRRERKNLGSRLQGHDLRPGPYDVFVKQDKACTPLCLFALEGKSMRFMKKLIESQYRVQLQLDSLPVLMRSKEHNFAIRGYPVGFKTPLEPGKPKPKPDTRDFYVYNHLKFTITYNQGEDEERLRITGFDVHPVSISHDVPEDKVVTPKTRIASCQGFDVENDPEKYLKLAFMQKTPLDIIYSYDVKWVQSDLEWADRWDVYLIGAPDDDIHYYSIVNSLMIVLFMTGAIATIMIRTLRKDIAGYNELQTIEDAQEETGWKLVHGDVFRPPSFSPMMMSVMVGTGAQLGCSVAFALLLSIFKVTNSMRKGQILTSLILLYVLCGSVAGYVSARLYKFSQGKDWKMNSIMTATCLPAVLVGMFAMLNVFLTFAGAATAVSILTIIVLFLLWVCISAPLVFVGAFLGLKAPAIEVPTRTNQIARIVPDNGMAMHPLVTMAMGGILPFGSVCIELAFIMSALWLHQIYYVMGFLLAVLFILAATCAQVSIVLCYLQLCAEDHRWWWKSFWNCATAGVYLFLYSLWFLSSRLDLVGVLPVVVYLTYMSMISLCFGLFCGAVGLLSSFWFTRTIYGAVKVD